MATDIRAIRDELAAITSRWSSTPDQVRPRDIFFPSRHLRALALDRMLVVGMRGAGKSFWSHVLCTPALRQAIASAYPKLGYDRIHAVCALRWDKRSDDGLPHATSVNQALQAGTPPSLVWLTVFLNALRVQFAEASINLAMPSLTSDWATKFNWIQLNPELAMRTLMDLDRYLEAKTQSVLVLTDALDLVTGDLNVSHKCVQGLFELLRDLLRTKGLRFKAFIREDMLRTELFSFPDASKLKNEAVTLDWSREELYALVWKKLGQESQSFRSLTEKALNSPWREEAATWINRDLEQPTEAAMERVLLVFAKEYMGNSVKRGWTYSWWFKHLSDSHERVSPRTFESSFSSALGCSPEAAALHVLTPSDIHEGVRAASIGRVGELGDDYRWMPLVMKTFETRAVPVGWDTVFNSWSGNKVKRAIEELCARDQIFVPWSGDDQEGRPIFLRLRKVLQTIGVIELRNEGSRNEKVDIPDIYRVGFNVGKKGGLRL
jgi:hypothetical protein